MLDPAAFMAAQGIAMRPVHHSAFPGPFVLAMERDRIARAERIDARCQVDIMGNEQCASGIQFHNEALMAAAFVVVRQEFDHLTLAMELQVAEAIDVGVFECGISTLPGNGRRSKRRRRRV